MGKDLKDVKDVIEFPDSTVNVNLKFDEKDMRLLDESEGSETSHISITPGLAAKFRPTIYVLISFGLLLNLLNALAHLQPFLGGFLSLVLMIFLYEWQRMHGSKLTKNSRASFDYAKLLALDKNYIPFYALEFLFGERYKGYVLPCTGGADDERTPNEPEARSPDRLVPLDPKFHR
uniref:SAYSvFN domain-containing protein n=1 Tax=Haemonchus contortus TaxID=6289 RepID=A0A7I4YQK1_HAECO